MSAAVSLTQISSRAGRSAPEYTFAIWRGPAVIGRIGLLKQAQGWSWSLPAWLAVDQPIAQEGLGDCLIAAQANLGIDSAHCWLTPSLVTSSIKDRLVFTWLRARSARFDEPSFFSPRFPRAEDAIALAQLVHDMDAGTVVGSQPTLSDSFDATFRIFEGDWGTLLEACSVVLEARLALLGAGLVTLYGETPLLALVAAASPLVARHIFTTVLHALAGMRYPDANLLLRPTSALLEVAVACGFEPAGDVERCLLPSS